MGFPATVPWKWIGVALAALLAVSAVWFAINAYGDARYDAGVAETDAQWKAASEKLAKQSLEAAGVASSEANARAEAHAERLAEEKKEIEDAIAAGVDPFDSMFPARRVRD